MNTPKIRVEDIRDDDEFELVDGRVLLAIAHPAAPGGMVLATDGADFVLRESYSDGRLVVALWQRVRDGEVCGDCGKPRLAFTPTDWTIEDLTPL